MLKSEYWFFLFFFMFYKNVLDVYDSYDVLLIDMHGVLWNGQNFFNGALDCLEQIINNGKKIIILSNTTLTKDQSIENFKKYGLTNKHFSHFITAGDVLVNTIKNHFPNAKRYFPAYSANSILDGIIEKAKSIEQSDFVFVGYLNTRKTYFANQLYDKQGKFIPLDKITSIKHHDIADFDEISYVLDLCLKHKKTLAVANPDLFAMIEDQPRLCQGFIGELYENAGGNVKYFGKPFYVIYEYAKQWISKDEKVAMIGDTPWTDILGGNIAGYDTVLVLSGVANHFLDDITENSVIHMIKTIFPKMIHKNLLKFSQFPTHIIKTFA